MAIVRYTGSAPLARLLASMLEQRGLEVQQPSSSDERRDVSLGDIATVTLVVKAIGKISDRALDAAIDAVVRRFRERYPAAKVERDLES